MIAFAAAIALSALILLIMTRLFAGPTLHDRALAANAIVMKAVLICAALAAAAGEDAWADTAITLLLGSFVTHAAALKFFAAGTFQAPMTSESERD